MARAYSDDLRERVAGAVLSGRSGREVAAMFGVSVASALKWSQRLRDTGSAGSRPMGGYSGGCWLTSSNGCCCGLRNARI